MSPEKPSNEDDAAADAADAATKKPLKRLLDDISTTSPAAAAAAALPVVLIIGASFGGLGTALRLIENGGTKKFHVIVVDSHDWFSIGGLWQFVWNSRLNMDQITFDLKDAQLPGVDLRLNTTVASWNVKEKKVILQDDNGGGGEGGGGASSSISYDHIVLACGVITEPNKIPGIENHINICTFDTVLRQKQEMQDFLKKAAAATATPEKPATFVLAIGFCPYKCPVAPFEMTFLMEECARQVNLHSKARFVITCPINWPMPCTTKPPFEKAMKERGIEFMGHHEIERIDDNSVIHYKNGTTIAADLIWTVYPLAAPAFVRDALPEQTKANGFITIEEKTKNYVPGYEDQAYAVGDCCFVAAGQDEGGTLSVPKAGEFAWKMGYSVADDLVQQKEPYTDRFGKCLAELGFDKGLTVESNFSNVCNHGGEPNVTAVSVEKSVKGKIAWVNGYLEQIFGKSKLLSLDDLQSATTTTATTSETLTTSSTSTPTQ
jgi:NADH dehydrogenase FAD-containing subunit